MEWRQNNFFASDDKALLDATKIAALLNELYQTKDYSPKRVRELVENSFCLGLYVDAKLIGFARIITDKNTLSWIKDFIIENAYRKNKSGTFLMNCLLGHPDLSKTEMILGTRDADGFFKKFGFEWENFMLRDVPQPPRNNFRSATKPRRVLGNFE
jgi:N-acetylglutamate synthase-like GNAT family acetyltransferase